MSHTIQSLAEAEQRARETLLDSIRQMTVDQYTAFCNLFTVLSDLQEQGKLSQILDRADAEVQSMLAERGA